MLGGELLAGPAELVTESLLTVRVIDAYFTPGTLRRSRDTWVCELCQFSAMPAARACAELAHAVTHV